jgi:hypothetical protein
MPSSRQPAALNTRIAELTTLEQYRFRRVALVRSRRVGGGLMMNHSSLGHIPGLEIGTGRHICALYFGDDERDDVLLPYLRDGLSRGSKCVVGISAAQPTELYQEINDAERYVASTQLVVRTSQDPLLPVEDFSIERLIEFWDGTVQSALQDGYPFVRLGAEAAWWMPQVPGMPEFIRYETELNRYAARHAQSILCLYDLTRYGAGVIVDLLRVHPIILLSAVVLVTDALTVQ